MLMNSDGEILIDTREIKHNLEEFEKVKAESVGTSFCSITFNSLSSISSIRSLPFL